MSLPSHFTAKVVGVSFTDGYPENLSRLGEIADLRWLTSPGEFGRQDREPEPLAAVLVREPDNPHDPNAVAIHIPAAEIGHIGHLPRALAARLAVEMDAGTPWQCEVEQVWLHPDHPDRPGITVACWRVDTEGEYRRELEAMSR